MMIKDAVTKIVNFRTPGAGVLVQGRGHISCIVKIRYFFKKSSSLPYSQALDRPSKYIVMMTKKGSTKIVNFMTSGTEVFVLGCVHVSYVVKMHYFFKNLLFFQA